MISHHDMTEVIRMTRAAKLADATRRIQSLLTGDRGQAVPPRVNTIDTVIDLVPISANLAATGDAARVYREEQSSSASGTIQENSYHGGPGSLSYRLYLPPNLVAGRPVVIMLHGCTQSPEDFALGTGMDRLADEFGIIVAYPRQTPTANLQKCWNWFKPGDQQRGRGEAALIAGIARQIVAHHAADAERVYVAGLSAGGAAAAIMADQYPDLFAAAGIHSGVACGAADDLPTALTAMKQGRPGRTPKPNTRFVPLITFHGDRDRTVEEVNSRQIMQGASATWRAALDERIETGKRDGGHRYTRVVSTDHAGRPQLEQWTVHGAGHAWSGGNASGSYTDPRGPDASREMVRFFLSHRMTDRAGNE